MENRYLIIIYITGNSLCSIKAVLKAYPNKVDRGSIHD